jgi:hypothetical protein
VSRYVPVLADGVLGMACRPEVLAFVPRIG